MYGAAVRDVGRREIFERIPAGFKLFQIHKKKSRGIPDLICERAVAQHAFFAE